MRASARSAGFTIIELMITLVVLAILFMIGLPSMATWMQNTQVRNSSEAITQGLHLARSEALRRNRTVQFTLADTLGAGCVPALGGTNWVVSLVDPTGACETAPSETVAPQIIQKRSAQDGSPNAVVTASGSSTVVFNGLGRAVGYPVGGIVIDVTNSSGTCQTAAGPIRCLQVRVSASGGIRMCDPAVSDVSDPRRC
jgi:type IV fimbrial biogenesis protein FimT